jgi:hypothetical protein
MAQSKIPKRYKTNPNDTIEDLENIELISTSTIEVTENGAHLNHMYKNNGSIGDFTESESESPTETLGVESTTCTSSPNIKVIPIAIQQPAMSHMHQMHQQRIPRPVARNHRHHRQIATPPKTQSITDISTVSTIEDILAQKVERIASHLETANNNILNVDGKIKNYRSENLGLKNSIENMNQNTNKSNDQSFNILNSLKDQIDHSLMRQEQVHKKLNRSLKEAHQRQVTQNGFYDGNLSAPVILPSSNYYSSENLNKSAPNLIGEDTKQFLNRIRLEANQKVAAAIEEETTKQQNNQTLDEIKKYLHQQNTNAQKQAAEIAEIALQQSRDEIAGNQREFESYRHKLENDMKYHKRERKNLNDDLVMAQAEIKSLKLELESVKKSFSNLAENERKNFENKLNDSNSLNYQNLNEISILKTTLEKLTSERADLENKLKISNDENYNLENRYKNEIKLISEKYENEILSYKQDYDGKLDHLAQQGDQELRSRKEEMSFYQSENGHLKHQLSILSRELGERDINIDSLKLSLNKAKEDLRNSSFPDDKLILSNKKFFVSIATILKDLNLPNASGNSDLNKILSDDSFLNTDFTEIQNLKNLSNPDIIDNYTNIILNKLAKAVERVNLAEKLKLKAEDDRQELKNKVKHLLNKIQKEKELKMERDNEVKEKSFQDTISVLQKELNIARKSIREPLGS